MHGPHGGHEVRRCRFGLFGGEKLKGWAVRRDVHRSPLACSSSQGMHAHAQRASRGRACPRVRDGPDTASRLRTCPSVHRACTMQEHVLDVIRARRIFEQRIQLSFASATMFGVCIQSRFDRAISLRGTTPLVVPQRCRRSQGYRFNDRLIVTAISRPHAPSGDAKTWQHGRQPLVLALTSLALVRSIPFSDN